MSLISNQIYILPRLIFPGPVGENRPKDSVRTRNEKNKKEERNGLILDVVQKNESVAWSFNIPDKC